jgi:hypothetical protein
MKNTEETPAAVIPDLPVSNVAMPLGQVIKDLEAKLKVKYKYDLLEYKEENVKLQGIIEEKVSNPAKTGTLLLTAFQENCQLELQNLTVLQEKHQLELQNLTVLQEKLQLELHNCSLLSENE